MKNIELEDSQIEDVEDLIIRIEDSFSIRFEEGELNIEKLKDLDSIVLNKIQKETDTLCTTQKVFYQLRYVFDKLNLYDADKLKINTLLKDIIPQKNRRKYVKQIDKMLGIKSGILCPNLFILGASVSLFIISIICCYFSWNIGLTTMCISLLAIYLCFKFKKNLNFNTIRELTENIVENNYLHIRQDNDSINKFEVKNIIRKWLSETIDYDIKKDEIINFSLKSK